ncbi:MAG: hypothetical protein WKF57_10565 [Nakamurella sp.]
MPITPQENTPPPADTSAAPDPDLVVAVVLGKIERNLREHLLELASEAMTPPPEGLTDDRRYLVAKAIGTAIGDLDLEARRLRGHRLLRQHVLQEVESLVETAIIDQLAATGAEGPTYAALVRIYLGRYLASAEHGDARMIQRVSDAGGDASDPPAYRAPAYRAPTAPHPNAAEES